MADVHGNVIHEALARVDAHERRPMKTAMRNNCFVMYFFCFFPMFCLVLYLGSFPKSSRILIFVFLFFEVFWLEMT